jgi:hypothetical protein
MRTPPGGLPSPLFPPPDALFQKGLTELEPLLRRVFPLKAKHRAQLPGGVRRLSAFLTVERDNLPPDYMTRPEYLAAYLNYFLPWNIYRQGRLLQGLGLNLPDNARILDLGAGPLTFLQALWMACPQLRARKLTYEGVDRAESVLKAGRHLFEEMSTGANSSWDIVTSRQLSDRNRPRADLLVAANFINELQDPGRGRQRRDLAEAGEESPEDSLLERWENQVAEKGAILLIEPAMRATARRLSFLREAALRRGWHLAAPCPHQATCPMPGKRGGPWCHFNFKPVGVPDWLARFSRSVRLPKERGSLSFLLLTRGMDPAGTTASRPGALEPVRVISEPFDLPGWQQGSYGCTGQGVVLLSQKKAAAQRKAPPQPGELLWAQWPERPVKDPKSGAVILPETTS